MFFGIGVEILLVISNLFSHLFLLKFPDIKFLIAIHIHFNSIRNMHSFSTWFSFTQTSQGLNINFLTVLCRFRISFFYHIIELRIVAICVSFPLSSISLELRLNCFNFFCLLCFLDSSMCGHILLALNSALKLGFINSC